MSSVIALVVLGVCYCSMETSASILGRPLLYGPDVALEKDIVDYQCEVLTFPEDEPILLRLFREGDRSKILAVYTSRDGEMASFPLLVQSSYDGYLECEARVQNDSSIQPTVSDRHHLTVVQPVAGAELVVQSGSVEFYEGTMLSMECNVTAGSRVSYNWLVNGRPAPSSPPHYAVGDQYFIYSTTLQDSGAYTCVASNQLNETWVYTSNSTEVLITVKVVASDPDISFTVRKNTSNSFIAVVACESTRGTPPITFSLYNRTGLVTNQTVEEGNATFIRPVVLDQHQGWLQCQANNGDQTAYSKWVAFEVVRVGGPVTMHYDYDIGENFAVVGLRFYCKAERGTFPRYQWFLNGTLLGRRGAFYWVADQLPEQSILLLSVGRSSAGTYHCQVSDSFDNTTVIRSGRLYMDKDVLNRLPVSVVAVVFSCFVFLIALVTTCCCIGVVHRRRHYGEKSLWGQEMASMVAASEDELDFEDYEEDADVVSAARIDDSDQGSGTSTEEWEQIEEAMKLKMTLEQEDEPGEEP